MHRILFIVTACALFCGCGDEIADETYATTGRKSINGIDAFLFTAKATGRTIVRTAYLSEEAQKADIIIHFEKTAGYPENVYRQLEAWMSGLDPEDMESDGQIVRAPGQLAMARSAGRAKPPGRFAPDPDGAEDQQSDPDQAEEELEEDDIEPPENASR
jgi:hypothetical protein